MGSIFGKSSKQTQTSSSSNQAFPFVKEQFGGVASSTSDSNNALRNLLLGVGDVGTDQGFSNFRDSSGYDFIRDQGTKAITGSAAAKGLLNSGATAKALSDYGQNTADTFYGNYLDRLFNLSNQGLQAGSLISGAGNVSQSTGKSTGGKKGLGGLLGAGLSLVGAG